MVWLRKIFVDDWKLKLLALGLTLGLWFVVAEQQTPVTRRFRGVPLNFQTPDGLQISNDPPQEIELTLSGPKRELERLSMRDLAAAVEIADRTPGEHAVSVTKDRVRVDLPEGVQVISTEPKTIVVTLEPLVERELDVEPRFEGRLPEGCALENVTVSPKKVTVRGPASRVNELQKAPTDTISLEGRCESFSAPQTGIDIPDRTVEPVETLVDVHVDISPRGR
jgi:hypothetical protein